MLRPFNRDIHLWLLAFAVAGFGYFGVQAVLFNLYLLRLGFGPQFIGLLIGSGQVVWALAALPAGLLGRRFGVRGALIAGWGLMGAAFAILLLVQWVPRPLWVAWLAIWWALVWVGAALGTVNSVPYATSLGGADAPRAFAVQQSLLGLAAFGGSLCGVALLGAISDWTGSSPTDPAPYNAVLWLTPIAFAAGVGALVRARPAPPTEPPVVPSMHRGGGPLGLFVLLGLLVFLQTAGEGTVRAFFNVYLDSKLGVAPAQIGVTMGLAQLLPVPAALAAPWLLTRFGSAGTLALTSAGTAAALLTLGSIQILPVAAAAYMAVMSMGSMNAPIRNVFSQQFVDAPWRTTSAAILTVGVGLGWASSAAVGGVLIAVVDFGGLFLLTAGLAAVAAMVAWRYQRSPHAPLPTAIEQGQLATPQRVLATDPVQQRRFQRDPRGDPERHES